LERLQGYSENIWNISVLRKSKGCGRSFTGELFVDEECGLLVEGDAKIGVMLAEEL